MSSTKKRDHAATVTTTAVEKKKAAPKPKKVKEPAAPKEVKEEDVVNEQPDVVSEEAEAGADGNASPAKKRKVNRFNPHAPSQFLNLLMYWRNGESLRLGLFKAQAAARAAKLKNDQEGLEKALSNEVRYIGLQQRLLQRREDVIKQLELAQGLAQYGPQTQDLVDQLLLPFAPVPEASAAAESEEAAGAEASE